nr:hypothetical protein [Tanacetum cinerariifolium]
MWHEGNQASKKPVKKHVKKPTKKPDSQSGEGTSQSPKWTKKQILNSKKVNYPFRLYASWMSREHSFWIKSLRLEHICCKNHNLGPLVTYKWIAMQYFKEIIKDPFMPLRKIRDDIRQKFMIDMSVGQCKRAKQLALFDHEGGLIEHYAKLYQYKQALLDSNPGSTCTLDVVEYDNGSVSFKGMYIYFKGVKDGWLARCRKGWFFHLLHDDLCLNDGTGITIISDSHKGLIDSVNDWLPEAEHKKYTRHIYANFKKKYSGLQYQRLFWAAASCTLEQQFLQIMDQIKLLDENAYDYLIQRNPNSWSRAFFEMDRRCAALKMESQKVLIEQSWLRRDNYTKYKEEVRDTQGETKELEVRKCDQSYGVSLQYKRTNDVPPLPSIIRKLPGISCIRDGNDGSGSGSGVIDGSGSGSGSGSAVNDGSGSGGRGGGLAGGRDVDEAPEHDTSDDGPAPEQGKSPAVDKAKASVEDGPALKKKRERSPSSVDGIRIYHKNRGRSERIANMKSNKPFQFNKSGTGSTPDKDFHVKE